MTTRQADRTKARAPGRPRARASTSAPTDERLDDAAPLKTRRSQAQRAYEILKRQILENDLPAGTQMLEQEVAERLDMSRTPVREALVRLSQDGMVEVRPRHGMRVLPVATDDVREIYEVLTSLEATAAELCAKRGLSLRQLDEMSVTLTAMETALDTNDLKGWADADNRFHKQLVDFSGNRRLAAIAGAVSDQVHRVRMLTRNLRPKPVASNRDHAELVAAIRARDAEAARRIHSQHLIRAREMLIGLLESHGLTQL